MVGVRLLAGAAALALATAWSGAATPVLADTIEAALVRAYQNNPQLNAQRASVRATDENVPQALSGYRPKVSVTASGGYQYTDSTQGVTGGLAQGIHGAQAPSVRWCHSFADSFQRLPDRQQDARGGRTGVGVARRSAGSRTDPAALSFDRLHGLSA